MYIVTRKGATPSIHDNLVEATQAAVKISDPPCWIWQVEVSQIGTLKRTAVAREEIQSTRVEGIWCIQNRSQQEDRPAEGQLYFTQTANQVKVLEYRRGQSASRPSTLTKYNMNKATPDVVGTKR